MICLTALKLVRNVMAHAQKPDFVFRLNGRVHLNRWGRQFSRLLATEVCASAWVMLDTQRSEVAWEYWLPTPFASFTFTSPPVRHRVPSHFNWTLPSVFCLFIRWNITTVSRSTLNANRTVRSSTEVTAGSVDMSSTSVNPKEVRCKCMKTAARMTGNPTKQLPDIRH